MRIIKLITPKLLFFVAFSLTIFSLLAWRLIDLQIIRGNDFVELADANRLFTDRKPVERGVFLDRYNDPLVVNSPQYFVLEDPRALYSTKRFISQEEALQQMASDSGKVGYDLERNYLFPHATSQVLGYTGVVSADDLAEDNRLHIEDVVGKLGLERYFDEVVRGRAGAELYEVNALGERQRKVGERAGVPGMNISTTIDPYLSQIVYEAMGDKRGAVVIMDASTGEVLSLVSTPTYDPTVLSTQYADESLERERREQLKSFFSHPQKLFFNRAISGTYPPGSVFKLITALAGLEEEAIDAGTIVEDTGVLEVGEYSYANWYYTQYGRIDGPISLVRAIARSNDIYFYKAAEWTGPQKLAEMARLFGLGEKTELELSGEAAGLVPDPAWKERELGERWYLGNTFHFGIGQDNLLVSPIQMAQVIQSMANYGTQCQPHIVENNPLLIDGDDEMQCAELGVDEQDLSLVIEGMLDACSAGGTAFPFFEHNQVFRDQELSPMEEISRGAIACKTGTSEFGAADEMGYRNTHGWFASIIGIDQERISAAGAEVFVEDEASQSATLSAQPAILSGSEVDVNDEQFRQRWLRGMEEVGFPDRLVMVALVESDEANPYREGSGDAAPVIKSVIDWIYGQEFEQNIDPAPADEVLAE